MPSGVYERTKEHGEKIRKKLIGKKRPKIRKKYEKTKKAKIRHSSYTEHGEKINRGKKSYKEYVREEINKKPLLYDITPTTLKNIRWFRKRSKKEEKQK